MDIWTFPNHTSIIIHFLVEYDLNMILFLLSTSIQKRNIRKSKELSRTTSEPWVLLTLGNIPPYETFHNIKTENIPFWRMWGLFALLGAKWEENEQFNWILVIMGRWTLVKSGVYYPKITSHTFPLGFKRRKEGLLWSLRLNVTILPVYGMFFSKRQSWHLHASMAPLPHQSTMPTPLVVVALFGKVLTGLTFGSWDIRHLFELGNRGNRGNCDLREVRCLRSQKKLLWQTSCDTISWRAAVRFFLAWIESKSTWTLPLRLFSSIVQSG